MIWLFLQNYLVIKMWYRGHIFMKILFYTKRTTEYFSKVSLNFVWYCGFKKKLNVRNLILPHFFLCNRILFLIFCMFSLSSFVKTPVFYIHYLFFYSFLCIVSNFENFVRCGVYKSFKIMHSPWMENVK